jgi:TPR repeat protein
MYALGKRVAQDDSKAARWFRKAAEHGLPVAQYTLGSMYADGIGVQKDDAEAVRWYRKAGEQGVKDAQHILGVMYANGQGVTKDETEAVRWYRKAAEQGDAESQYKLGVLYAKGDGVIKDDAEAIRWFRKADAQGIANAKPFLDYYARIQPKADAAAHQQAGERVNESPTCNEIDVILKKNSQTRMQFALDSIQKMNETVGYDVVRAIAGGNNNKYLLFFSTPQNEPILRQVADAMTSSADIRANFCMQGFAEVQFLVRDANQNQKLIKKYRTNMNEIDRAIKAYSATPVQ